MPSSIKVRLTGGFFDDTFASAKTCCAEVGAHFLSPFDNVDVIEGQASVAVEMPGQLGKPPEIVILPVGGGGLSSGVRAYLAKTTHLTKLYFVEPEKSAGLMTALAAGQPVTLPGVNSFVDGAAIARIGNQTFAHLIRDRAGSRSAGTRGPHLHHDPEVLECRRYRAGACSGAGSR